jgi:hypothetical protein
MRDSPPPWNRRLVDNRPWAKQGPYAPPTGPPRVELQAPAPEPEEGQPAPRSATPGGDAPDWLTQLVRSIHTPSGSAKEEYPVRGAFDRNPHLDPIRDAAERSWLRDLQRQARNTGDVRPLFEALLARVRTEPIAPPLPPDMVLGQRWRFPRPELPDNPG